MANKNIKSLKANYEKAIKKEQALSSLMLMNLVKYKQAKASGDEKAIEKFTKIAGQLSPKKKKASELANDAYQAYEDMISGLHSDAELQIDEVRELVRSVISKNINESLNEGYATWKMSFADMNLSGVELRKDKVYTVKARTTVEAIKKASKMAGLSGNAWMATQTQKLEKIG